jgi:RNA-binding protein 25
MYNEYEASYTGGGVPSGNINGGGVPMSSMYPMNLDEQLRTVFIGGLPAGIPDQQVLTALRIIPGLDKWLRVTKADGTPADVGFARYTSLGSVKAALEVLSKVVIKHGETDIQLRAMAENNTHKWINSRGSGITVESVVRAPISDVQGQISLVFSRWLLNTNGVYHAPEAPSKIDHIAEENVIEFIKRAMRGETDEDIPNDLSKEEEQQIRAEIAHFREESMKFERKRLAADEEYKRDTQKRMAVEAAKALEGKVTVVDEEEDREFELYTMSDEEQEDSPQEEGDDDELVKSDQLLFTERERRWLLREKSRADALDREKSKEEERENKLAQRKEIAIRKFAEFDDDATRSHEYYYDHGSWAKARYSFRRRELEDDRRDAQEEQEEEKQPIPVQQRTTANGKISLSLGGAPAKKPETGKSRAWTEEEEEEDQPSRALKPLPRFLESEIPSDNEKLFEWPVKWEHLDGSILGDILRPFVTSNVVEYLGVQEDDLIDFIMQHIASHKPPQSLVKELEMTLDEDAPVLTAKVWRLLVAETERKSGH